MRTTIWIYTPIVGGEEEQVVDGRVEKVSQGEFLEIVSKAEICKLDSFRMKKRDEMKWSEEMKYSV